MSRFVIVVPESWLHQYAVSVRADCSVPASTVLSLGFPFLIIQLPFIYSLGISQSCKFGVNLYDVLNIAHLSFWIISSIQDKLNQFLRVGRQFKISTSDWFQNAARHISRQNCESERYRYPYVHSSTIHSGRDTRTAQMSTDRGTGEDVDIATESCSAVGMNGMMLPQLRGCDWRLSGQVK